MIESSEHLAQWIAGELRIGDGPWVDEAVRRRHRILFSRYEDVSGLVYELLRDSIKADLVGARR